MSRVIHLLAASASLLSVLACDGNVERPSTAPTAEDASAGAAPPASADAGAGTCTLAGDQCVGAARCCPPRVGYRVDLARNCHAPSPIALACDPPLATPSSRCGTASDESSCLSRVPDAGPDAGIEVYFTNVTFGVPPGFTKCGETLGAYDDVCP